MNTLRKIAACIATWLIAAHPALALNDTIGVTTGSGKTANLIAFAGGNVISEVGICDATTANQCAAVSAGGALLVAGIVTVSGTVTADAGTNLNTSALALETGGNLATTASGASRLITSATRIAPGSALATTSFVVGSRYVATPPTFTDGLEGAFQIDANGRMLTSSRTTGNIGGVLDAVTGATVPANALQIGMAQGGNLVALTGTTGNLNVQCANCSGSGVSVVDAAAWATGSSVFAPGGGVFDDSATVLTSGTQGTFRLTTNRALHTNLRNAAGAEVGVAAVPLQVSLANTATNATAVKVDGSAVTQPVSMTSTTITGTVAVTQASGSVASGAYSSGAYASGSIASGAMVDLGAIADAAATVGSTGTLSAKLRLMTSQLDAINTNVQAGTGATGSAVPSAAIYPGLNVGGNLRGATAVNPSGTVYAQQNDVTSVNGVTVLTGTGATGTGAQRVTVSTDQATNAGAALVKGGVGVVNGGSTYQHVAASQTGAVLQTSTGAAGDYLSHCVIYPSTTAAGSVTVFDNTNAAGTNVIEFATGTLSNLAPIPIPVGAVSTSGAWKVTTGANETVVCYGKFS